MDSIWYYVKMEMLDQNSGEMREAKAVMNKIDTEDSEFVALALKLKAFIWSHDKHFIELNQLEGVTRRDILKRPVELPSLWEALNDEWFKQR